MAWSDTTRKNEATGGGVATVSVTLNSTVAGNLVVCGTSCYNASDTLDPVVTDGGNTWTKETSRQGTGASAVQGAGLSWSVLTTGGNRTITSDPGANTYDMWVAVHEFAGSHATPASGTSVGSAATGTAGTTSDTTAMTPADNDVLVVAVEGHTASGTTTENASPGDSGFSLSNDHESGSAAEPGSMVFKIISGAPGTPRHAWTIPSSHWAALIMSFKPASISTGLIHRFMLLGVGI